MKLEKKELLYLFRLLEQDRSICQMHLDESRDKKPLEKSMKMITSLQKKIDTKLSKLD